MIHSILVALGFLTIIPVRKEIKDERDLLEAIPFFPLIGLLLGGILLLIDYLGAFIFSPLPLSLLTIGGLVVLTGGLHLDGFADTIDGLVGGKDREGILKIMRDPNVGVMGIFGIYILLSLKVFFLNEIPSPLRFKAVLLMPAIGRYGIVVASYLSRYARDEGKGRAFIAGIMGRHILGSTGTVLVPGVAIFGLNGLLLLIIGTIIAIGIRGFIYRKIGGMTGDTLGFTCEVVEMVTLCSLVIMENILT